MGIAPAVPAAATVPHHGQRGGVLVLTTLWMAVALACLLVLDIGNLFWQQRELQKVADLAAQAGASAPLSDACRANDAAVAGYNARANGFQTGSGTLQVQPGVWQPQGADLTTFFTAGAAPANACQVTVTRTVPYFFVWPVAAGGSRTLTARATAVQAPQVARLAVRSTLVTVNSSQAIILNAVLGGLLGGSLNLSAAGWEGLLGTQLQLLQFLDALALELGLEAGDYAGVLRTQVELGVLLHTMLDVLQLQGGVANGTLSALQDVHLATVAVPPLYLQLQQLLQLQAGTPRSALATSLGVFDLVQTMVQTSQHNQAVAGAVLVPLGVAHVAVRLKVVEPPQLSALGDPARARLDPLGPDRLWVRTAQVRVLVSADLPVVGAATTALNALLKLVSPAVALFNLLSGNADGWADLELLPPPVRLDVSLDLGGGAAWVTDFACQPQAKSLTTTVRTAMADIRLGRLGATAQEAATRAFSSSAPVIMGALPVLDAGCLGCDGVGRRTPLYFGGLGVRGDTPVAARTVAPVVLAQPPRLDAGPPQWAQVSTQNIVQSLSATVSSLAVLQRLPADPRASPGGIQSLWNLLDDVASGLLGLLSGLIGQILAPVLDPLVNTLLRALGIDLAVAEVGGQLNCGGAAELVY